MTPGPDGLDAKAEAALIALVRRAAQDEILPRFRRLALGDVRAKAHVDDLVTEADLRAEAAITRGVAAILPGAQVVGEEAVAADPAVVRRIGEAAVAVIVDPVDGTWNFANGLATFGVILAVTLRGETAFGLLYDPVMDDWILARRGGGTWFCRPGAEPVRLGLEDSGAGLGDTTGFVPLYLFPQAAQRRLAEAMPEFRRVWSVRCACHEYRLLAQGSADFCLTGTLNPWDHAAGVLAVTEAGGAAALLSGETYAPTRTEGYLLVARSARQLEDLRGRLAPLA